MVKKMKTVSICTLLLACGSLCLTSCKGDNQTGQQAAPELSTLQVSESDADLNTNYPATLHGKNDVEIRPQITGFLTKVNVQEGQRVSAGQLLFTIDQVQLQAAVDAAKAAVAVAQANVNTMQTNANNNKILFDKNIISASAYQTSIDQLNAAKAQLGQAQANLVSSQKNLSYTLVKAPAAGVVGTIDNKEGSLVSPSTLLTILSNNGEMEAYFSMTEKEILALTDNGRLSVKQVLDSLPAVQLKLANGDIYSQPGRIISISGVLDPSTGSATVKAAFPNPDGMLRSGNTGQVLLPTINRGVITIPQKATFELQDMKFVFVVGDSSKVHQTPIEIDSKSDGVNYIVTKGLKSGDVVVIEGVGSTVKDGMVITPKK